MDDNRLSYKWQDRMGYIFALSALLCPYIITRGSGVYSFEATPWSIRIYEGTVFFGIHPLTDWVDPFSMLVITGPHFLTAYFMYRYYRNKTSLERVYYVALIMISPMLIIGFISFLPRLTNPAWPYGFDLFPFPVIVIIFAIITYRYPRRSETPRWLQTGGEVVSENENPVSSQ
jgi:hypothetical protein